MAKKDRQFSVRLPSELLEQVRRVADAEDRSVGYVIERIIREHFDRATGKGGKAEK